MELLFFIAAIGPLVVACSALGAALAPRLLPYTYARSLARLTAHAVFQVLAVLQAEAEEEEGG